MRFQKEINMTKFEIFCGVVNLILACVGIYITIIDFSIDSLLITVLSLSLGITLLELNSVKLWARLQISSQ